ncbi:MAG: bifunctional nuclease domain-containing protein [Thermomicrobiales bacterium]
MGFGEKEAAEIGRAMRLEQPSPDASRAIWMEMIEQRGATLDRVAITDLVDGTFRASIFVTQDGRSFELPARPVEAVSQAVQFGAQVVSSEELMRWAAATVSPTELQELATAHLGHVKAEYFCDPLATFYPTHGRPSISAGSHRFAYVFVFVLLAISIPMAFPTMEQIANGNVGSLLVVLFGILPFYGFLALLIRNLRRNRAAVGRIAELEFHAVGVRLNTGAVDVRAHWRSVRVPEKRSPFRSATGGITFRNPRNGLAWIALSGFDENWREGDIGKLIRRYAPRLMGNEPVDPDGGSTIF